jgi:hypothetical protein
MDGPWTDCDTPPMQFAATDNWADALLDDGFWLGPDALDLTTTSNPERSSSPSAPRPLRATRTRAAAGASDRTGGRKPARPAAAKAASTGERPRRARPLRAEAVA